MYFFQENRHSFALYCWSLFWQSSDYPIYYQSPEEPAQIDNGKPAAESNTSPSGKHSPVCACVSVLLVLCSVRSMLTMIQCTAYSTCRTI